MLHRFIRLPQLHRRQWNNVIILGCLLFIGILNLPSLVKTLLIEEPYSGYPKVLNPSVQPTALHLPRQSILYQDGSWRSETLTDIEAIELVQRWRGLVGTPVNDEQYLQLSGTFSSPVTVEVWYQQLDEPQRITAYQFEQFWLLKNWQENWLAVTFEGSYLGL